MKKAKTGGEKCENVKLTGDVKTDADIYDNFV